MYIESVPNRSSPPAILLRESLRGPRPRQEANPRQPLQAAHRRHQLPALGDSLADLFPVVIDPGAELTKGSCIRVNSPATTRRSREWT